MPHSVLDEHGLPSCLTDSYFCLVLQGINNNSIACTIKLTVYIRSLISHVLLYITK